MDVMPGLVGALIRVITAAHRVGVTAAVRRPTATSGRAPRSDVAPAPSTPALALAQAVREQLTRPGSVPAARQFELIMAERAFAANPTARPETVRRRRWTPYLSDVDPCPYRDICAGSWQLTSPEAIEPSR